jgi:hypothetical protein
MAVLMPVAYLTLTALAMFTLDTGSWETRGAPGAAAVPLDSAAKRQGDHT